MRKRWLGTLLALCLVLSMMPTTVFAESGSETEPKTSVNTEANDMSISKRVVDNEDGTYDLVMEAYATGTSQTTTVSKPLDIVLVLDVSGSMDDKTTSRTYTELESKDYSYQTINNSRTTYYYKDSDGEYHQVYAGYHWHMFSSDEYYLYYKAGRSEKQLGNTVTSSSATIYTGVLYTATSTTTSKLESMKTAAKNFVNTVSADATTNNVDHKISIVKFAGKKSDAIGNERYTEKGYKYNYSQTVIGLTDAKTGATTLNTQIDALVAGGATQADYGMQLANSALGSTTATDRQKVVILFTDGEPTSSNRFETRVANSAISASKTLKDAGTVVYTVGMLENASTNVTNFLEYTSSNYPNAKSMTEAGQKITTGDYSTIVSDGTGLDDVFKKIAEEAIRSESAANETSSLTDTLSEYFDFSLTEDGKLVKCTAQKVPCTGENTWGTATDITNSVTVTQSGKDIAVSGYDYTDQANLVVKKSDGTWQGNKLVLTFTVKPASGATWKTGTNYYPTNNTTTSKAGVYAEDDIEILALDESPEVPMSAAKVSYQVTGDEPATASDLPKDAVYLAGATVSVAAGLTTTVTTKDGKTGVWTFNGWDRTEDFTIPTKDVKDVTITGTWSFRYTETTEVAMTKIWDDDNNRDGVRPESIYVQLLDADNNAVGDPVTLTAKNADENGNWVYTWEALKYDDSGKEITYHVAELGDVSNYTSEAEGMTITNKHELSTVDVKMTKVWDDDNNRDGVRPENISVQLYANGQKSGDVVTVKADANGAWTYTWKDLYKNENGKAIAYTVEEVDTDKNYSASYSKDKLTVTNKHSVEKTERTVTKVWNDGEDRDQIRPETVTVNLLANGTVVDNAKLSSDNQWTYTWENLNVNEDGKAITYTVQEANVAEGYEATVEGMTVTNKHTPKTTEKTVTKVWEDEEDQDGVRPETVEVQLYANGEAYGEAVALKADAEGNWTYTWKDLYANENGKAIKYTVKEVNTDAKYTESYSEDTFTITNTHSVAKTEKTVTKVWDDDDNRDGIRPESVTVNLLANEEIVEEAELNEENGWSYTWKDLDVNAGGQPIEYKVEEADVAKGYEVSSIEDMKITNFHQREMTNKTVVKEWDDNDDCEEVRPDSVHVNLLANGEIVGKAELNEENQWSYEWEELFVYEDGKPIEYTVEEVNVDEHYNVSYDTGTEAALIITNTLIPQTTDLSVEKVWKGDTKSNRPDSITVEILANGEVAKTVKLTADDDWATTISDLPVYEDGKKIEYTVKEKSVKGYTTEYSIDENGTYVVTNTLKADTPAKKDDTKKSSTVPKTGDSNDMSLWFTLLFVSGGVFAGSMVVSKKRKNRR